MKKIVNILYALVALLIAGTAFVSCVDNITCEPTNSNGNGNGTFTMTVTATKDAPTKALAPGAESTLTATWVVGDKVTVYNDSQKEALSGYLEAKEVKNGGTTTSLQGTLTGTIKANDKLILKYLSPDYATQDGTLTGFATSIDKVCDYAEASVTVASVASDKITTTETATFVNQQAIVKFTLKEKVTGNPDINASSLTVVADGKTYTITPSSATNELYVAVPGISNQTVKLLAIVGSDRFLYERQGVTFTNGQYYDIPVKMTNVAVDLGHPSIKWASVNVGAMGVTDYGDYFAWGETLPYYQDGYSREDPCTHWINNKSGYNWTNYSFCNGSETTMKKYCTSNNYGQVDNKTELESTDDAASVNWGGNWRTPTDAEWTWLQTNCTWVWKTNYNGSGEDGMLVTSMIAGYTENSIFLPAAGFRWNAIIHKDWGSFYYSSTLNTNKSCEAFDVRFYNGTVVLQSGNRFCGTPIRPVMEFLPAGAISGKFTVSNDGGTTTSQVYFSQGNLQAVFAESNNSSCTWQFAPTQYSIIGNATANTAVGDNVVTTAGTVDLFGWVGANSSLPAYGINNNTNSNNYGDTSGEALKSDWGNTIGTGWRTLTKAEWVYLFNTRTNASQKYGHGSVNGVLGMIILPDDWELPSGLSFTPGNSAWSNSYTTAEWEKMETNGAVFLPASGYRQGTSVYGVGDYPDGGYWSSTSHESYLTGHAYCVYFYSEALDPQNCAYRWKGHLVRLVRNAN